MSVLAHPGSFGLAPSPRRRRHLTLVPAAVPTPERKPAADVVALPVPAAPRRIPALSRVPQPHPARGPRSATRRCG